MTIYHKRGGLHFIRLGKLRVQWCIANAIRREAVKQPAYIPLPKTDEWEMTAYPPNENPAYRNALIDAGRGRLLR